MQQFGFFAHDGDGGMCRTYQPVKHMLREGEGKAVDENLQDDCEE